MTEVIPVYLGEAMLVRWSDNHRGRTVTFQLEMEAGENPFRGYKCGGSGQRVKLCAVLVGDDEGPVRPKTAAPQVGTTAQVSTEAKSKEDKPKSYTRSQIAALKCADPSFQDWFQWNAVTQSDLTMSQFLTREDLTNALLKEHLGITSKRELDTMPNKAAAWDSLLATYDNRDLIR